MDKNKVNKKRGSEGGDIRILLSKKQKDNEGIMKEEKENRLVKREEEKEEKQLSLMGIPDLLEALICVELSWCQPNIN